MLPTEKHVLGMIAPRMLSSHSGRSAEAHPENAQPRLVILMSGKRKSGKDYVAGVLENIFKNNQWDFKTVRLSAPLKEAYAKENQLDIDQLMSADAYKEEFRAKMIAFGEAKRQENPEYFCKLATQCCTHNIWLVVDCRRTTDFQYFFKNFPTKVITLRIEALESVRQARGYVMTPGVDDAESECGLDDFDSWNFVWQNNGDTEALEKNINALTTQMKLAWCTEQVIAI